METEASRVDGTEPVNMAFMKPCTCLHKHPSTPGLLCRSLVLKKLLGRRKREEPEPHLIALG